MSPKISIALATYNGAAYLKKQLESYLSQSHLPDELVISDDCSTDETISIIEKFSENAPFEVRIYQNQKNFGVTKNFEQAISKCTGDYIFLSDQDDIWLPDKIEVLSEALCCDSGVGAVFCNAEMCDEMEACMGYTIWEALFFNQRLQEKVKSEKAFEVFLKHPLVAGMTMAFRADLRKILFPFPNLHTCHDIWVLLIISAISKIKPVDRILVHHRVHGKNLSSIVKRNLFDQYLKAISQIKNNIMSYDLSLHQEIWRQLQMIEHTFPLKSIVKTAIQQKIKHLRKRVDMPKNHLKRLSVIGRELISGNYALYSYGWKSALQDMFLR